MKYTVFDIETVAAPDDQLPVFDTTSVAVGNLKDPAKIKAKIDEASAEWRDTLALSPMTGQVAMVGFLDQDDDLTILDGAEIDIVSAGLDRIAQTILSGGCAVGFNCLSFDMPFLLRRAYKLGLKLSPYFRTRSRGRSYWHENIIDLRDEWLMGDRSPAKGTTSLAAIAAFLGLPEKLGDGKDFAGLTADQRKAYLQHDLEITKELCCRIIP